MHNPFEVVQMFEDNLAEYTGAPYAVTVDSCTNAIMLCCLFWKQLDSWQGTTDLEIPYNTYLSVPQAIMNAGFNVKFRREFWEGIYKIEPFEIYDSAKRLTSGMYKPSSYMCLSFHHKKLLPIGKGGAILTGDGGFVEWAKQMRHEGRTPLTSYHEDDIEVCGFNMYMTPEEAARGLTLLSALPGRNLDQVEYPDYRDLRTFTLWSKNHENHS